jgi:Calcineurin-like phosphoesterase
MLAAAMANLRDHDFFHQQFEKIAEHLEQIVESGPKTRRGAKTPPSVHAELLDAVRAARAEAATPVKGAYYSRNPVVSLAQSAMQQRLEAKQDEEEMGDQFTKADIGWIVEIGLSLLWRLLHDRHRFCDEPATATLEDNARLVLVSDWGTGLEEAKLVAAEMRRWFAERNPDRRPVHVVHLGDTYYSGTEQEVRDHILAPWPVQPGEEGKFKSWALNGNHDMYSGGRGYFDLLLNDPRFSRQRTSSGVPTSWFTLRSGQWNVLGLDTAWNDHLPFGWLQGHLYGSQDKQVAVAAADPERKLLLLSHHQLFTANDEDQDVGEKIQEELKETLAGPGVDVWFWGHEHDCVAYHPHEGVRSARAIGHGAVPEIAEDPGGQPDYVDWRYTDFRVSKDGEKWAKHGFAVLDLNPESITVNHVDDEGVVHKTEELPK